MPFEQLVNWLPDYYKPYTMIIIISSALLFLLISKITNRKKVTLTKKQTKSFLERKEFLQRNIKNKKVSVLCLSSSSSAVLMFCFPK